MGKLSFQDHKFRFTPTGRFESACAKSAKLVYDAQTLQWTTRKIEKAVALRRFADPSAEREFKSYFITPIESSGRIEWPAHLKPKLFQIDSAHHILSRTPAYIADQAGLGKTITSVLATNAKPHTTLVICPPYLKYNWYDEFKKWNTWKADLCIWTGNEVEARAADVLIMPDSIINRPTVCDFIIRHFAPHWLFIDEAHRYKEPKAQRTKALFEIVEHAERVVYLSGTPMPNRPMEIFPILNRTAHSVIDGMSELQFGKRFCAGKQVERFDGRRKILNWDFRGASNLPELRKRLYEEFMIRHLKKDVLKELPKKQQQLIFLDQPKKLLKYEKAILKNHTLTDLIGQDYGLGDVACYRKECGLAKIKPAIEFLKDLLEASDEKIVVFAHHIDVVESIALALKGYGYFPLVIRGGISSIEKQKRVKAFQKDKKHRLIIGNIDAMGVGLTLTSARRVVMVECSWTPGVNEQAEDRVHRITQTLPVTIQYLVLRDSLDERVLKSVMDKQKSITQALG